MKFTAQQIRAIHAKSKGTLPIKDLSRSGYDVERLVGTDNIILRKKGQSSGTLTTRDDFSRMINNIEQQEKIKKLIEQKMNDTRRRSKLTDTQLRQLGQIQGKIVRNSTDKKNRFGIELEGWKT